MAVGKLYWLDFSPPARAVLLVEKALDIELEHIEINFLKGEQHTDDYLKMNPQHTIPTFVDEDGTVIWDSHAIIAYLVEKHGKDDALYPKDLAKRALVDQRLHFETGNVFYNLRTTVLPMVTYGDKGPNEKQRETIDVQYDFLNKFVSEQPWMAGDSVTIADLSLITSISSLQYVHPIDEKFDNLLAWIKRCEELPYYEVNDKGARIFGEVVKPFIIPIDEV